MCCACMCVLIPVDMTNVCTLCGEYENNDGISGQQWVTSLHVWNNYVDMHVCIYAGTV